MVRQADRPARTGQRPTPAAVLLGISFVVCVGVTLVATDGRSPGLSVLIDGRRTAGSQDAAVLRLEILQTERTGPTGRLQSSTARTVAAGAATTLHAVAGRSADANLCDAGFVQDPSKGQPDYAWQIDATVVAVSATETTLKIRWARSRREQSGVHEEDGETARLTLASRNWRGFWTTSAHRPTRHQHVRALRCGFKQSLVSKSRPCLPNVCRSTCGSPTLARLGRASSTGAPTPSRAVPCLWRSSR